MNVARSTKSSRSTRSAAPALDRVRALVGDVGDVAFIRDAVRGADSVFHLAAVVSGAAEADFDLGLRVNLDGTRALLEALRGEGRRPKVVFSSSVAVFGGALPEVVDDATTPMPQSSYGVQKLIGELLVGDYSRKGYVDGRAVRLPTIVVRPGKPNAAASSFASGIIREPLAGVEAVCPVDPDTVDVGAVTHGGDREPAARARAAGRAVDGAALAEPSRHHRLGARDARSAGGGGRRGGACARAHAAGPAHRRPSCGRWPARFDTARADAMGFVRDGDFESIVRGYAKEYVR